MEDFHVPPPISANVGTTTGKYIGNYIFSQYYQLPNEPPGSGPKVSFSELALIRYFSFNTDSDGHVLEGNITADQGNLLGPILYPSSRSKTKQREYIRSLPWNVHKKVKRLYVNIGEARFDDIQRLVYDGNKRRTLATESADLVVKYGLDGVYVGGKFPNSSEDGNDVFDDPANTHDDECDRRLLPEDPSYFYLLLNEIYTALVRVSQRMNRQLGLEGYPTCWGDNNYYSKLHPLSSNITIASCTTTQGEEGLQSPI